MLIDPPVVVCKPQPAGSASQDEFYLYSGSLESLTRVNGDQLSTYEAIDDAPTPNVYRLPYQHGWLLEFRRLFAGIQRWVVFAQDGRLYLDNGSQVRSFGDGEVTAQVRRFSCLVRVRVTSRSSPIAEKFWVQFPFSRLIFWDPVVDANECEPLCDIFTELATPEGRALWTQRWTSGHAFRSTALTVQKPNTASPAV